MSGIGDVYVTKQPTKNSINVCHIKVCFYFNDKLLTEMLYLFLDQYSDSIPKLNTSTKVTWHNLTQVKVALFGILQWNSMQGDIDYEYCNHTIGHQL